MALFLPFTPRGKQAEETAIHVKRKLGLGPYEAVDPFAALSLVPARLIDIAGLPNELQEVLCGKKRDEWSAVGFGRSPADGHELILLNPCHHDHRRKVSLMEEVVHVVLDHPKVPLLLDGSRWSRPFNREVEDEAFNVGAACIIPYKPLFNAVKHEHAAAAEIADRYDVSVEYVDYRIKRAGLYRVYRKHCT